MNQKSFDIPSLVSLLSPTRAEDNYTWLQVGQCLFDISSDLLEEWIKFSKKSSIKFSRAECERLWTTMTKTNYTVASLYTFAKEDKSTEFNKMDNISNRKLLCTLCEPTHFNIAQVFNEKFPFRFKCVSIKNGNCLFYEYISHRWVELDNTSVISNLISTELVEDYINLGKYLGNDSDEEEKNDLVITINKIIYCLENNAFKEAIIKEYANLTYDPTFTNKLNENTQLVCFNNGVYDLCHKKFRNGCPDDNISFCTGYDYLGASFYSKNDIVKEINDYFDSILKSPDDKCKLMNLLSNCLPGSHCESKLYVLVGTPTKCINHMMQFFKLVFGDYFEFSANNNIVKNSRNTTVSFKKGCRIYLLSQIGDGEKLTTTYLEQYNSQDHCESGVRFTPQFKSLIISPSEPEIDIQSKNDVELIYFNNKNLSENKYEDFNKKFTVWKEAFMSMLISGDISH